MRSVFDECRQVHEGKQAGFMDRGGRWKDKPFTKAQKKAALANVQAMKDYADELYAEALALGED